MLSQYEEELTQDPYNVEEFIERLTWRTTNDINTDQFDPDLLYETFISTITDLKILQGRQQKKCEKLEESLKDEQIVFAKKIGKLQEKHQVTVDWFHQLDEKINSVAGKIIHLGEQLDNVNTPRSRTVEAQRLLNYMTEFLEDGTRVNDMFNDKSKLFEAADIIQKLYTISQDLPAERFADAKKKIEQKYDEIERDLIEKFAQFQRLNDIEKMKSIATILSQFKGYSQCIDAYIEQSEEMTAYGGKDIFAGILPMCRHHHAIIKQVFASPDQVMSKLILNIYQLKLNQYAQTKLEDKKNEDKYLKTLYDMYSRTMQLSGELQEFMLNSDDDLLAKLTNNIFAKHLSGYIEIEAKCLEEKSRSELKRYYESKNHQKKQTKRFPDFTRDVQALIGTRTNLNIAQIEDYGGETFLSEELAINLLQESKAALKRCRLLSKDAELSTNIIRLADILLQKLLHEHVDYALELGVQAIPIESKSVPQIYFFDVVQKCNTIIHLLEKLYTASVIPSVISTSKYSECLSKKRLTLETIETKLDTGLDRSLNSIVGWVKIYLQTEQKKNDFKPDSDIDTVASLACLTVVQTINPILKQIQTCVDGENLSSIMMEFGVRLHRVIFEHLQQFQYNSAGAMCAICDVNEYRKCVKALDNQIVVQLFDILHALCNLLLVKQENLQEVCSGDTLNYLEKSVVLNFIQLRTDHKTIRKPTF